MSKHTPGPWSLDGIIVFKDKPYLRIAVVTEDDDQTDGGPSLSVRRANARLISAAPDLLDALMPVLGKDNSEADEATQTVRITLSYAEMAAISAAVAKAKGRDA